jgi:C4-dicarboxylate-specific signal transduction histidine kinase
MKRRTIVLFAVTVLAGATALSAQSLADVARKEAERRKQVKESSRVYTNADVKASGLLTTASSQMTAPAPEPPATTDTEGAPSPAAAAVAEPKKDEAHWRQRMADARERQRRLELFADSLQSRINALTTDFVNRDDPAQREMVAQQRRDALAELDRVNDELADARKAMADIEEEARRAGVPPGWLR